MIVMLRSNATKGKDITFVKFSYSYIEYLTEEAGIEEFFRLLRYSHGKSNRLYEISKVLIKHSVGHLSILQKDLHEKTGNAIIIKQFFQIPKSLDTIWAFFWCKWSGLGT